MILPSSNDIERAVRRFVALGSGVNCVSVVGGQSYDRSELSGVYASLLFLSDRQLGTSLSASGNRNVTNHRLDYSLQFYRLGASDAAARFKAYAESLTRPLDIEVSTDDGTILACADYLRSGVIQRLDGIISGETEERATVPLTIGVQRYFVDETPSIEAADIIINANGVSEVINARS